MHNLKLEKIINTYLGIDKYHDSVPNGLQVEGCEEIKKIVTGVTASQSLLNTAVCLKAHAIIVHHGYFWKNESNLIKNIKRKRLKTLLSNNINLYAYHIPLDAHPVIGNNVQLGNIIGVNIDDYITPLLPVGRFSIPISSSELMTRLKNRLDRQPLYYGDFISKKISTVAWCSGKGQKFIETVAKLGIDAFITGEVSEETFHISKEMKIHFYSAGHHATERYGIKALGEWIKKNYNLDVTFIDIPNPA
ncbi:MAG: Nif3-like dinuclear metal center hexameric protein [Arsenophonus sp.]|nr:MAG: Nif3-like dinuclear metal center hexameric protein [Arsenophonus sp.]